MYVCWIGLYEGASDSSYFDILIPRLMNELTLREGQRAITIPPPILAKLRRPIADAASDLCALSPYLHLIFIHADVGGRSLADSLDSRGLAYCRAVRERCQWPSERCIIISPRHEMEAWALSDAAALSLALGTSLEPHKLGLPSSAAEAERLPDPKAVLQRAVDQVRRKRSANSASLLPQIASGQSLDVLRGAPSFREFETQVRRGLASIGCLPKTN